MRPIKTLRHIADDVVYPEPNDDWSQGPPSPPGRRSTLTWGTIDESLDVDGKYTLQVGYLRLATSGEIVQGVERFSMIG